MVTPVGSNVDGIDERYLDISDLGLVASVSTLTLVGIGVVGCHTTDIGCIMQIAGITRVRLSRPSTVHAVGDTIPDSIPSHIYRTITLSLLVPSTRPQ